MRHKVLFVDDEPFVTKALRRSLHDEPYDIICASSAREALEKLGEQEIAVVVSDEQMPEMPGSELLSLVRRHYPDTIRIILTGQASLEVAIKAINDGEIYRFFTKPCNTIDLATSIRQALKHRDLVLDARKLMSLVRRQSLVLEELEQDHPGITKVKRDADGTVILSESDLNEGDFLDRINLNV